VRVRLLAIAAALGLLAACSGSPPEILATDLRLALTLDPSDGTTAETLRFYVAIRDPDGSEDPALIVLEHAEAGLRWELGREEWIAIEYAGDMWYGAPDLRGPSGGQMPRGRYSIAVEDQALTRVNADAFLTAPEAPEDPVFPMLEGSANALTVSYSEPVVLRVYSRAGQMRLNQVVRSGPVPADVLELLPDESGLLGFVESTSSEPRLISGPFRL
jgi:hypothetical protein